MQSISNYDELSPAGKHIYDLYMRDDWKASWVENAAKKGRITQEEADFVLASKE